MLHTHKEIFKLRGGYSEFTIYSFGENSQEILEVISFFGGFIIFKMYCLYFYYNDF